MPTHRLWLCLHTPSLELYPHTVSGDVHTHTFTWIMSTHCLWLCPLSHRHTHTHTHTLSLELFPHTISVFLSTHSHLNYIHIRRHLKFVLVVNWIKPIHGLWLCLHTLSLELVHTLSPVMSTHTATRIISTHFLWWCPHTHTLSLSLSVTWIISKPSHWNHVHTLPFKLQPQILSMELG